VGNNLATSKLIFGAAAIAGCFLSIEGAADIRSCAAAFREILESHFSE
jgi:hypothetical protein